MIELLSSLPVGMWQGRGERERSGECAAMRAEEDECRAGKKWPCLRDKTVRECQKKREKIKIIPNDTWAMDGRWAQ